MNEDNLLALVAVVAVVIAVVGAGTAYYRIGEFNQWMTGFVTETATINITVEANAALNFTTDNLTFGTGRVNAGSEYAEIDTSTGLVDGGTWATINYGLVLVNIGNVNVSVDINGGKNATTFFGGYSTALYQYNVSDASEAGSCIHAHGTGFMHVWKDMNTTQTRVCSNFSDLTAADSLQLDFKLRVPAQTAEGAYGDIITITYLDSTPP
jgi:hypothetical protein